VTPKLSPRQTRSVSRISGLVLINALVFQEILAEHNGQVDPLQKVLNDPNPIAALSDHWQFIVDNINYFPIFYIAREILANLTANADVVCAIRELAKTAQRIVSMRAALRHDLMGRVYHRLLSEAKYLGTYYTSIPAATLLLKLALRADGRADWRDLKQLEQLRVADLSCGTGTLLMASADTFADAYIRDCAANNLPPDATAVQRILAEQVLHGFDVLPSAIHLTASTLALRAPQIAFTRMNLFSLPLGGPHHRLGSIEFLAGQQVSKVMDLFGAASAAEQTTGTAPREVTTVSIPALDFCVMNPPFVRSVGGNLLFGSVPESERKEMQKRLQHLVQQKHVLANSTAGLGSVFVAIGDRFLKPGGCMALVLPKALLSGVAWDRTRELLRQQYRVEYIVASHDPLRWNFSDSTDLSETLLVAVKKGNSGEAPPARVTAINLTCNPMTAFEALAVDYAMRAPAPDIETGQGALPVTIGGQKVGEAISMAWDDLRGEYLWMLPCAYAQSDLIRAAFHMMRGRLWLPGHGEVGRLTLCKLDQLGKLGPDRRDIHDGFDLSKAPTAYPAFWGHDAKAVFTLAQGANAHLSPLSKAKPSRHLRKATDLWPLSGRLLLGERFWLKTQRLVAVRTDMPVLSNMWWTFNIDTSSLVTEIYEKALALWLNSTLGILMLLANREETRGAWVDFKKPVLNQLPVLDVRALTPQQLQALRAAYDNLSGQALQPFPHMDEDAVRKAMDAALAQALGLPDFSILRTLLAQEPVVCLRRLGGPASAAAPFAADPQLNLPC
jgi:hypothetical protein